MNPSLSAYKDTIGGVPKQRASGYFDMMRRAVEKTAELPLNAEQQDWLANAMATPVEENPCVRSYGKGPDGEICKHCALLYSHTPGKKTFWKCELRPHTNGPGSDHRVKWKACAKFEPLKET